MSLKNDLLPRAPATSLGWREYAARMRLMMADALHEFRNVAARTEARRTPQLVDEPAANSGLSANSL